MIDIELSLITLVYLTEENRMNNLDQVINLEQLINVGYFDLGSMLDDGNYTLNVSEWHEPQANGLCAACVAGAVIAKTLKSDITASLTPSMFDDETFNKLTLLNYLRTGEIGSINRMLMRLNWPTLTTEQERVINSLELREADLEAWKELAECI